MSDRLFTIVCDFRGGTYVSQVRASDERDAVREWTQMLVRERPIKRASTYLAKSVTKWTTDDPPVATEGLSGVWSIIGSCGGDIMFADIIDTAMPVNGS